MFKGGFRCLGRRRQSRLPSVLGLCAGDVFQAFLAMEMQGLLMRGVFERVLACGTITRSNGASDVFCNASIAAPSHALRKQIEPVAPSVYMALVARWQHLAPPDAAQWRRGRSRGSEPAGGLLKLLAIEWERTSASGAIANYDSPAGSIRFALSGAVGWGRISLILPGPALRRPVLGV